MDHSTVAHERIPHAFCDWLDVTFPSDSALTSDIDNFLASQRCLPSAVGDSKVSYKHPNAEWGNFLVQESSRGWTRLSASGGSCSALSAAGAFDEYLALIGSYPHTVTRLDAAHDIYRPAPPIIKGLVDRYPPDSKVYLTRKGVTPDYYLKPLQTGDFTGTFYAGHPRNRGLKVSARVYDKEAERIDRAGIMTGPWTRYEVIVRKGVGATLKDAQDPTLLFWHFASPALLKPPAGVPPWTPNDDETWAPGSQSVDPYQRLRSRVNNSVDIDSLIALADQLPRNGRSELLRLLRTRIGLRDHAIPLLDVGT